MCPKLASSSYRRITKVYIWKHQNHRQGTALVKAPQHVSYLPLHRHHLSRRKINSLSQRRKVETRIAFAKQLNTETQLCYICISLFERETNFSPPV